MRKLLKNEQVCRCKNFYKNALICLIEKSDRGILSGIGELLDEKQNLWVKEQSCVVKPFSCSG